MVWIQGEESKVKQCQNAVYVGEVIPTFVFSETMPEGSIQIVHKVKHLSKSFVLWYAVSLAV